MSKITTYINTIENIVSKYPDDNIDGSLICDITDGNGDTITTNGLELSLVEISIDGSLIVSATNTANGKVTHRKLSSFNFDTIKKIWEGLCRKTPAYSEIKLYEDVLNLGVETIKKFTNFINYLVFDRSSNLDTIAKQENITPKAIIAAVCEKIMNEYTEHNAAIENAKNNILALLPK